MRWTVPFDTAQTFRAELIDAGLLTPTDVDGLYHRSGQFEEVVEAVQRYSAE